MLNVVRRSQIVGWIAKVKNHTIILVDDGIATGATIRAAIATLKKQQPRELVVAVQLQQHPPVKNCKQK
ncbi:phosphoribosyltransferase [Nostoc sp. NIES-4103]|nr:phosphoribosyltransferase [Nostoc sp. NIES-4103]